MLRLFDYIYYRIYKFFYKQKDNVPETKGSVLLTVLECFTLLSLVAIIRFFWEFPLPNKLYFVPLVIFVGILNWYRYERNFDMEEFTKQWEDEDLLEKKKKGWLIVVYFAIVVLFPVALGVLEHNFGII